MNATNSIVSAAKVKSEANRTTKRHLSKEYRAGTRKAVKFLKGWQDRPAAPWLMAEQFSALCEAMPSDKARGARDALWMLVQIAIDGCAPNLDDWNPLEELENPGALNVCPCA